MDATSTDSLVVDRVHCGPPESGNGGWTSGELAAYLSPGAGDGVTVRLSSPPPLDAPMTVTLADGVATLTHAGHLVATARPGIVAPLKTDAVDLAAAADAETRYEALAGHPFSTCFSCGTDRDPEEALCLRPGPLADGSGRYAARWTPPAASPSLVWAALDCPGGWSAGIAGRPMVLGEMTAAIDDLPVPGEEHVVIAWQTGTSGRKHRSASVVQTTDGRILARATATWIAVDPATIRPKEH